MARILFVKPTMTSRVNPGISHPLGILYLAAVARRDAAMDPRILDLRVVQGGAFRAIEAVRALRPDVLGLSALTVESGMMHRIALAVREERPDLKVVAGGPHASVYPEETLANGAIDVAVLGEGEDTFTELLPPLVGGGDLASVRGIAHRVDGQVVRTEPRPYIEDVDGLPFPAWDLLDLDGYWRRKSMGTLGARRYMTLFTSRACPYECFYCHRIFGKGFRARSPASVLAEMEALVERHGVRDFEIVDDVFNLDRRRVERICDGIVERGWRATLSFPNGLRGDLLDRELLEKLARAGTRYLVVAIETASPRLQKLIRKNLNLERAREAIADASRLGILCGGFFMLGFPTETDEEMRSTVRFAVESRLLTAQFFVVTPFLGTEMARLYGEIVGRHQADFDRFDYFRGSYNLSAVSDETLRRIQRRANLSFYFRPGRIWRILKAFPRKRDLPLRAWRLLQAKVLLSPGAGEPG